MCDTVDLLDDGYLVLATKANRQVRWPVTEHGVDQYQKQARHRISCTCILNHVVTTPNVFLPANGAARIRRRQLGTVIALNPELCVR
jgi:hypothetical protein